MVYHQRRAEALQLVLPSCPTTSDSKSRAMPLVWSHACASWVVVCAMAEARIGAVTADVHTRGKDGCHEIFRSLSTGTTALTAGTTVAVDVSEEAEVQ